MSNKLTGPTSPHQVRHVPGVESIWDSTELIIKELYLFVKASISSPPGTTLLFKPILFYQFRQESLELAC